jgi:hypothetical protein
MRHSHHFLPFSVLIAIAVLGCGGSGGDGDADSTNVCDSFSYSAWTPSVCPQDGQQTRTAESASPLGCNGGSPVLTRTCTPGPATGTIVFKNSTSRSVHEVHLVRATVSDWGAALNTASIAPGGAFTISNITPGTYSGLAVVEDDLGPYFAYNTGIPVDAGETLHISAGPYDYTGSITVTNGNTAYMLTGLYVKPASGTDWGLNLISMSVPYNYYWLVYGLTPGSHNVRCVHSNGASSVGTWTIPSLDAISIYCN